jgi:hypothetical protein
MEPIQIHNLAWEAAQKAAADFIAQYGEPFYCGFAWVEFSGNTKFARALKKAGIAGKAYPKGMQVWNPGGNGTQSMDIKEVAARAYASVLCQHGVDAWARSRAD